MSASEAGVSTGASKQLKIRTGLPRRSPQGRGSRRHHRAKTHFGWIYARNPDGGYTWTGPQGHRLTVDHRGIVTRH
jgi:hypothetical protein